MTDKTLLRMRAQRWEDYCRERGLDPYAISTSKTIQRKIDLSENEIAQNDLRQKLIDRRYFLEFNAPRIISAAGKVT